ncbi:MAG: hypothetical protein MHM6MM_006213 [Cercozoa sp. M6MM]
MSATLRNEFPQLLSDFSLEKIMGSGTFSKVLAVRNRTGQRCAAKLMRHRFANKREASRLREVQALQKLK